VRGLRGALGGLLQERDGVASASWPSSGRWSRRLSRRGDVPNRAAERRRAVCRLLLCRSA
jgi:hypothetical protein